MNIGVRLMGIVALAVIATTGFMTWTYPRPEILSLSLSRSPAVFLGLSATDRATVQDSLDTDTALIVAYGVLFCLLAWCLAQSRMRGARGLAVVAVLLAGLTVVADYGIENRSLSQALTATLVDDALADRIYLATKFKWACFFLTLAVLAPSVWRQPLHFAWVGDFFMLAATVGLIGQWH